jgi:putative addiction module component (TIGR02574 family)
MDSNSRSVLEAALALPEPDRAWIARELLSTLGPDVEDLTDDELADELTRRLDEALRDPTATLPWAEVRDQP